MHNIDILRLWQVIRIMSFSCFSAVQGNHILSITDVSLIIWPEFLHFNSHSLCSLSASGWFKNFSRRLSLFYAWVASYHITSTALCSGGQTDSVADASRSWLSLRQQHVTFLDFSGSLSFSNGITHRHTNTHLKKRKYTQCVTMNAWDAKNCTALLKSYT